MPEDRHPVAETVRDVIRTLEAIHDNPELFMGLSIYRMLGVMLLNGLMFFHGTFSLDALGLPGASIPYSAALLLCCTVVFALLAANVRCIRHGGQSEITYAATALIICGMIVMRGGFVQSAPAPIGQAVVGGGLAAAGFSVVHIEFGRIAGYLGTSKTLIYTVASSLVGIILFALAYIMPEPGDLLYTACIALMMAWILELAKDRIGRRAIYRERTGKLNIPWRFIATSFAQGLTIGIASALFQDASGPVNIMLQVSTTVVACICAFATVIVMKVHYDRLIYRIGFLAMGAGFLMYALGDAVPSLTGFSLFVQIASFTYLDIVLWSFGSYLIKHLDQPAVWATCCPTASLMGGRFLGTVLGAVVFGAGGSALNAGLPAHDVSAMLAFFIVAAALLLSSSQNVRSGWGFVRPGEPDDEEGTDSWFTCRLIASDYSLTARETEVLALIAQGASRHEAAEALCVSDNTIKTHVRGIYGKLGVHSREELASFIEASGKPFAPQE